MNRPEDSMVAMNRMGLGWVALALVNATGCAEGNESTRFCVVDMDCPGALVCDEGTCWEGETAAEARLDGASATLGAAGSDAADEGGVAGGSGSGSLGVESDEELTTPGVPGESRCSVSGTTMTCTHEETTFMDRLVYWQLPNGEAPAAGWPAVLVFHGSGYGPDVSWEVEESAAFGGYNQIRLQASLLDNGFAVIAPTADGTAWATNFGNYEGSSDHKFIPALLDQMEAGGFGSIDMARLYATGMSSGGYMTSRMAVTYPGRFVALAINSGSYATCSNALCTIPAQLPSDHPPTIFLHGEQDIAVPLWTMQAYHDALDAQGFETVAITDPMIIHQWLKVAPEEITNWFLNH